MRKNLLKKITAAVLSLTMVVGTTGVVSAAHAANGANVAAGKTWTSFSVCTKEDGGEWYDAVAEAAVENPDAMSYTEAWIPPNYNGCTELNASTVNGGFWLYVANSGWDGEYNPQTGDLVGDNPWGLTTTLSNIPIERGRYYTISFKIKSSLTATNTVKDANGNDLLDENGNKVTKRITTKHVLFKAYDPVSNGEPGINFVTTSGATTAGYIELDSTQDWKTVTAVVQIPSTAKEYAADVMGIKFAMGANLVTYPEELAMSGSIYVKDFKVTAGTQYTVTFTNGSTSTSTYVNSGATVSQVNLGRKGYTLTGYRNRATGAMYNFSSPVTSNLVLEAVYTKTKAPAKPVIKSLKSKKKKRVTVTLKKKVKNAVGYQIQYSTKKKMKSTKKATTTKKTYTIKKLKSKKMVYVRVRAYTLDSAGKKVYGKLSAKKKAYVK